MTIKDTLEGDNMYTCSQCGKKVRAEKRSVPGPTGAWGPDRWPWGPVALGPDLIVLGAGLVALGASLNPDQQIQD